MEQLVTGLTLPYPPNTLGRRGYQVMCGRASVSYGAIAMHAKMSRDGRILNSGMIAVSCC